MENLEEAKYFYIERGVIIGDKEKAAMITGAAIIRAPHRMSGLPLHETIVATCQIAAHVTKFVDEINLAIIEKGKTR